MTRTPQRGDDGFTVVEVVVAMSVFAVMVGSVLGVLINTLHLTADNSRRAVAANLVEQQIEAVRTLRAVTIADGGSTTTQTVGGTTYTVAQTASYVTAGAASSVCSSTGSALAYKLVTVSVTWPGMGTVRPVRADTLRALGIGADGLDPTKGVAAVGVLGAGTSPSPVSGVVVTLSPGGTTTTTGSDGCAVFTGLAPSTVYTASVNQPGYVGQNGTQTQSTGALTISAATVTRATIYEDAAQSAVVTLGPPSGFSVPSGIVLAGSSTYISGVVPPCAYSPTSTCSTSGPGALQSTLQNLYPTTYSLWAGSCSDARPTSPAQLVASPGTPGSVSVPLSGVSVTVVNGSGTPTAATVYAVHAASSGSCSDSGQYTLGTSGASALQSALPYGTWTITTNPSAAGTGTSVTLTPTSGQPTVTVVAS